MYTLKQAADIMNLTVYSLRYYVNEGLFPDLYIDEHGTKYFSNRDLERIFMIHTLSTTGMSIAEVKHYIMLCDIGNSTAK